jgi:hypothetical protein
MLQTNDDGSGGGGDSGYDAVTGVCVRTTKQHRQDTASEKCELRPSEVPKR